MRATDCNSGAENVSVTFQFTNKVEEAQDAIAAAAAFADASKLAEKLDRTKTPEA